MLILRTDIDYFLEWIGAGTGIVLSKWSWQLNFQQAR